MDRQQTKLYFAIWKLKGNEKLQAIKYFISCGEDIHERDKNELTPLHQAVGCGDVEAVKLLLGLGANPNAIDIYGRTPLFYTAFSPKYNSRQLDEALIAGNADTTIYDVNGHTRDQFVYSFKSSMFYRPEPEAVEEQPEEVAPSAPVKRAGRRKHD
ncbi:MULTISPECIES: ankyrin repeat domain-containing protein [Enterobacterales]|nr:MULTISPECIES: ankyrin repeat domain-containing protein [Enterobacterales]EHR3037119.1 ankyrin repeat domain-containing protein [Salmonella enterica]MCW9077486.1 ankyrin repeat domain-containing protein [Salmonella enterica]WIJ67390.1 ankyrin repeat domain-containing protein [Serratia nevei]HDZ7227302.1 ankyrin repeat domain-containing protein [Escherichia coli]